MYLRTLKQIPYMSKVKILWADDEIDLLKPQLFFLEKKGYEIIEVTNGHDALEVMAEDKEIDCVFLDESMPGISGLETLEKIRETNKNIPVVMITKNEAEDLMEEAIGSEIHDYLIKPVNPNQILLSLKKIIDNKRLVSSKTATDYQQEFRKISMDINSGLDREGWNTIYKRIIEWEIKLDNSDNEQMRDILDMQKSEANNGFCKYVTKEYKEWTKQADGPVLSHNLFKEHLFPALDPDRPNVLVLFDNLRFDQWRTLQPTINEYFRVESEEVFYSILPTSTQYSRNAIFAGMTPLDIQKNFPQYWLNDNESGGKNQHEEALMQAQIDRLVKRDLKWAYYKIRNVDDAKAMLDQTPNFRNNELTVIVYNFIDMLSHARTEMDVLKELASDEKAYRSLTKSWFINSPIWSSLQSLSDQKVKLFITTDHGTIRVNSPSKVKADRETSTNLRYKVGKNLNYKKSDVLDEADPHSLGLPRPNISSKFIFALESNFFLYPNNYNRFNRMYNDTFQHGGLSMEEMICPFVTLESR